MIANVKALRLAWKLVFMALAIHGGEARVSHESSKSRERSQSKSVLLAAVAASPPLLIELSIHRRHVSLFLLEHRLGSAHSAI